MSTSLLSDAASANSTAPSLRSTCLRAGWADGRRGWLVAIVLATIAAVNVVGTILVVRRFSGGLVEPLPRGQMLLTAMIATALGAYSRTAWQRVFFHDTQPIARRLSRLVGWGSSLGLLLLAVGCCWPANRLSDWLIWLPLLVADQFWRHSFFHGGRPRASRSAGHEAIAPAHFLTDRKPDSPSASELASDEQIIQQLHRVRNTSGQEMVFGTLRADFGAGQRTTTVHVGFCPPLSHRPQVEAEPLDGPDAVVKVVQTLPHGARLDVRLATPATEACQVQVDFAALPANAAEHLQAGERTPPTELPSRQKAVG